MNTFRLSIVSWITFFTKGEATVNSDVTKNHLSIRAETLDEAINKVRDLTTYDYKGGLQTFLESYSYGNRIKHVHTQLDVFEATEYGYRDWEKVKK